MPHANVFSILRPQRVAVSCADRIWWLDFDTAHHWIGAVAVDFETLAGVFPGGIVDGDVDAMYQLSLQLPDIGSRWSNTARAALGRGSGRDWWWSLNLIKRCISGWPYINGKLLLSGVDSRGMPLADWLDAVYMLLWGNCDEKERIKLDMELSVPPAGVAIRRSKEQTRRMLEDFAAD